MGRYDLRNTSRTESAKRRAENAGRIRRRKAVQARRAKEEKSLSGVMSSRDPKLSPVAMDRVISSSKSKNGRKPVSASSKSKSVSAASKPVSFKDAFANNRKQGKETFSWTSPRTGKTTKYTTRKAGEGQDFKGGKWTTAPVSRKKAPVKKSGLSKFKAGFGPSDDTSRVGRGARWKPPAAGSPGQTPDTGVRRKRRYGKRR